ncbi:hypothetical protein [uncultured Arcticibacterium sp.]|uniref:DoxX family protein n=1 Tax=uncultured Arcticibacterium sp. TaxID=2173042 RepID=UPI0030F6E16E
MKPLIVLLGSFILCHVILYWINGSTNYQLAGRVSMAIMLLFTALGHFMFVNGMARMIPDNIPYKVLIVQATGIIEIAFAIALLLPKYSYIAGILLIIFFLLILPANIKASMDGLNYQTGLLDGKGLSYLWFRVPLQMLFIIWVYFSAVKDIL